MPASRPWAGRYPRLARPHSGTEKFSQSTSRLFTRRKASNRDGSRGQRGEEASTPPPRRPPAPLPGSTTPRQPPPPPSHPKRQPSGPTSREGLPESSAHAQRWAKAASLPSLLRATGTGQPTTRKRHCRGFFSNPTNGSARRRAAFWEGGRFCGERPDGKCSPVGGGKSGAQPGEVSSQAATGLCNGSGVWGLVFTET